MAALALASGCVTPGLRSSSGSESLGIEAGGGDGEGDADFYDALNPYGQWVDVPGAGEVWQPSPEVVGQEFQPYSSGGHWVNTDYGWSFDSDYEWGWATFHYGRWLWHNDYGWCWRPARVWGPAWVDWRYGGGYVGWAPLPPLGYVVVVAPYHPYWTFVEPAYLVSPNVYHYAVPVSRVSVVYTQTVAVHTTVNGSAWYAGPPPARIATAVGAPIPRASISPPPPGRVVPVRASLPAPGEPAHFISPGGGVVNRPMTPNEYKTFAPPRPASAQPVHPSAPRGQPYRGTPASYNSAPAQAGRGVTSGGQQPSGGNGAARGDGQPSFGKSPGNAGGQQPFGGNGAARGGGQPSFGKPPGNADGQQPPGGNGAAHGAGQPSFHGNVPGQQPVRGNAPGGLGGTPSHGPVPSSGGPASYGNAGGGHVSAPAPAPASHGGGGKH